VYYTIFSAIQCCEFRMNLKSRQPLWHHWWRVVPRRYPLFPIDWRLWSIVAVTVITQYTECVHKPLQTTYQRVIPCICAVENVIQAITMCVTDQR